MLDSKYDVAIKVSWEDFVRDAYHTKHMVIELSIPAKDIPALIKLLSSPESLIKRLVIMVTNPLPRKEMRPIFQKFGEFLSEERKLKFLVIDNSCQDGLDRDEKTRDSGELNVAKNIWINNDLMLLEINGRNPFYLPSEELEEIKAHITKHRCRTLSLLICGRLHSEDAERVMAINQNVKGYLTKLLESDNITNITDEDNFFIQEISKEKWRAGFGAELLTMARFVRDIVYAERLNHLLGRVAKQDIYVIRDLSKEFDVDLKNLKLNEPLTPIDKYHLKNLITRVRYSRFKCYSKYAQESALCNLRLAESFFYDHFEISDAVRRHWIALNTQERLDNLVLAAAYGLQAGKQADSLLRKTCAILARMSEVNAGLDDPLVPDDWQSIKAELAQHRGQSDRYSSVRGVTELVMSIHHIPQQAPPYDICKRLHSIVKLHDELQKAAVFPDAMLIIEKAVKKSLIEFSKRIALSEPQLSSLLEKPVKSINDYLDRFFRYAIECDISDPVLNAPRQALAVLPVEVLPAGAAAASDVAPKEEAQSQHLSPAAPNPLAVSPVDVVSAESAAAPAADRPKASNGYGGFWYHAQIAKESLKAMNVGKLAELRSKCNIV